MIVIAGVAHLHLDRVADAVAAGSAMAAKSLTEPGCTEYRFAVDIDNPSKIHLFEQWDSAEALAAHFATPHFAEFSAAIIGFLAGDATFTRYEVSSAGPLFG